MHARRVRNRNEEAAGEAKAGHRMGPGTAASPRHSSICGPGRYTGSRELDASPSRALHAHSGIVMRPRSLTVAGAAQACTCFPFDPADHARRGHPRPRSGRTHSREAGRPSTLRILRRPAARRIAPRLMLEACGYRRFPSRQRSLRTPRSAGPRSKRDGATEFERSPVRAPRSVCAKPHSIVLVNS